MRTTPGPAPACWWPLPSARYFALPTCRPRRYHRCCATSRPRSNCAACRSTGSNFLLSTIPTRWPAGMPGSRSRPACCSSGSRHAAVVPRCRLSIPISSRRCGKLWPMRRTIRHLRRKPWLCRAKSISPKRCRSSPSRRSIGRAKAPARTSPPRSPDRLTEAYGRFADRGPYRIDGEAIGRRALRNVCLGYLAAGDPERGRAAREGAIRCRRQYDRCARRSLRADRYRQSRTRGRARGVLHALGG